MNANYKRIIFFSLLFFSLLFSNLLNAKEVEPSIMQRVALNAFSQSANISLSKLHISDTIAITEKEQKVFTIFNFKEGGYIIVSNEDVTEPILGYGFESNINLDNIPPGLEFLLNEYKNEIYSSTKNELAATQEIKERWERYTSTDQSIQTIKSYTVGDILLETEWNQNAGYQQCCPNYPGTQTSCVVGCAGVALGQILYYWNCRTFPQGIVKYLPLPLVCNEGWAVPHLKCNSLFYPVTTVTLNTKNLKNALSLATRGSTLKSKNQKQNEF